MPFGRKTFLPGGCALNTCRALRWLDPCKDIHVAFVGSVGQDDNRHQLEDIMDSDGIQAK